MLIISKFYILMVACVHGIGMHVHVLAIDRCVTFMTVIAILDSKHNQRVINRDYTVENNIFYCVISINYPLTFTLITL